MRVGTPGSAEFGAEANQRIDHRAVIETIGHRDFRRCRQPARIVRREPDCSEDVVGHLDADAVASGGSERRHWCSPIARSASSVSTLVSVIASCTRSPPGNDATAADDALEFAWILDPQGRQFIVIR